MILLHLCYLLSEFLFFFPVLCFEFCYLYFVFKKQWKMMSNDYIIITYAQVCAKTWSWFYLLYNVAIELNYVNVLTEEMSFIFYDGQKEKSIIIECRILKFNYCWKLLPATCDTVMFVTNLNTPTHWQNRVFKLVNDLH